MSDDDLKARFIPIYDRVGTFRLEPIEDVDFGGGVGGGSVRVLSFPFAFDTPDILTGAALYTPTPGDVLLDAWIQLDELWNVVCYGEIGTFVGSDRGLFNAAIAGGSPAGVEMDFTDSDATFGEGIIIGPTGVPASTSLLSRSSARAVPALFSEDYPLRVCVTLDGIVGGGDPGATSGAATLYLLIATPNPTDQGNGGNGGDGMGAGLRRIVADDIDVTVDAFNGTTVVLYTALTAPRTVTLPPASGPTQIVTAIDVNGQVSSDNSVTLVPADGDSLAKSGVLNEPQAFIEVTNDGAALWAALDSTQQMSYALDQIAAILGQPTGASIVRAFPFAFDTPDLLTGAALYTPTPGDILLDAWIEIDTAWDGTTPLADLGTFVDEPFGFYGVTGLLIGLLPVDMTIANTDAPGIVGGSMSSGPSLVDATAVLRLVTLFGTAAGANPTTLTPKAGTVNLSGNPGIVPLRFTSADPIKVCVSQDGTNTGDDPASTQGAAILYLVTASPAGSVS